MTEVLVKCLRKGTPTGGMGGRELAGAGVGDEQNKIKEATVMRDVDKSSSLSCLPPLWRQMAFPR